MSDENRLPYGELKAELDGIAAAIAALLPGARVILFGSYARGEQRKWSDLDLCVIADSYPMRLIDMMNVIFRAVSDKTKLPIDLLLFHRENFERRSKLKPTIEYAIAKEGVVLNG